MSFKNLFIKINCSKELKHFSTRVKLRFKKVLFIILVKLIDADSIIKFYILFKIILKLIIIYLILLLLFIIKMLSNI